MQHQYIYCATPISPSPLPVSLQAPSHIKWLLKGEVIDSILRMKEKGLTDERFLSGVREKLKRNHSRQKNNMSKEMGV